MADRRYPLDGYASDDADFFWSALNDAMEFAVKALQDVRELQMKVDKLESEAETARAIARSKLWVP